MTAGDAVLEIEPPELRFPFELKKQISCSLHLTNLTDVHVAFKVKTTSPKKYCVRPNSGILLPRAACDVVVTMQAQRDAPPDMQCNDKFLVQSVIVDQFDGPSKEVTPEMFSKESGYTVHEEKLYVIYSKPAPVREGSEEGSSPKASVSDNGHSITSESGNESRVTSEPQEKSTETMALISRLTEEKDSAIQQNNKLRQELETLRRDISKQQQGTFPFMFVVIVALLAILLGYFVKA